MTSKLILFILLVAALTMQSVTALDVETENTVHFLEEEVEVRMTDMNGTGLLEVDMPNGTPLLFRSLEPENGSASFTFTIAGPSGEYSIWATDRDEMANCSFELRAPQFAIGSFMLSGKPVASRTVDIDITVFNNGTTMGLARVSVYEGEIGPDNLVNVSNILLNGGEEDTFIGAWTPSSKGSTTLIVQISAVSPGEWNTTDNTATMTVTVGGTPEDDEPTLTPDPIIVVIAMGVVTAVVASAAIGALMSSDSGRYALACALLPFYTKLNRKNLLDNRNRFLIYGFIVENPGEYFSAIKSHLSLTTGTVVYHLRILEREGKIVSAKDGKYRRFYVRGGYAVPDRSSKLTRAQMEIVEVLVDNPGLTQQELAMALFKAVSTINHHVRNLESMDVIRAIDTGKGARRYVVASALPPHQCPFCDTVFSARTADYCPGCGRGISSGRRMTS